MTDNGTLPQNINIPVVTILTKTQNWCYKTNKKKKTGQIKIVKKIWMLKTTTVQRNWMGKNTTCKPQQPQNQPSGFYFKLHL